MEVSREMREVLREALGRRRDDETFERTLGKVVRKRQLPFEFYRNTMDAVRTAMKKGETPETAAETLCSRESD